MTSHIENARILTNILENQYSIFGIKFGVDFLIGLIPWAGDAVAFCLSLYLLYIALDERLPYHRILLIIFNIISDFLIGLVPIVGDISDLFYRSNSKNLAIIETHIALTKNQSHK